MNLPPLVPHPVFLDMDGVLSDFFSGVARLFDRPVASLARGEYDMIKVLGVPFVELNYRIITSRFWADLDAYPWAQQLANLFDFSPTGDAFVLSTPWPGDEQCLADKAGWCRDRLGIPEDRVILTSHKHLFAGRGRLLIDDRRDECVRWQELGGRACEFPAHHNAVRLPAGQTPVDLVRACLATFRLLFPPSP
jgi:hypothetical protein